MYPTAVKVTKSGTNGSVTTTAAAISTTSFAGAYCLVQADPDNTDDILLGDSASQDIQMKAGDTITLGLQDLRTVFVKSVSGTQRVNFLILGA